MASRTFYVDANGGSDSNDGLTPQTAWGTLDQINSQSFQPGDQILFQRGDVFEGRLAPGSSGGSGNPISFGAYGTGANPVLRGSGGREVVDIDDVSHIRLIGLDVTGGKRGILLSGTTGSELIDVNVYGNSRDGIYFGGDSHHNLVQGGSAHDNGEEGAKYHAPYGRWINLGHGVLVNGGAHDNTIEGIDLYANAEDGVQFGNSAGDGNMIRGSRLHDNLEDGVDIKSGSQTLISNLIAGNTNNAVLTHNDVGTITLTGNDLSTVTGGNALDLIEGARVISNGNRYEGVNSPAVQLAGSAGDGSVFRNDIFVDGGLKAKVSVDVSGGDGHLFENVAFVMQNSGAALGIENGASATVQASAFYTDGTAMDGGADGGGNSFHGAALAAGIVADRPEIPSLDGATPGLAAPPGPIADPAAPPTASSLDVLLREFISGTLSPGADSGSAAEPPVPGGGPGPIQLALLESMGLGASPSAGDSTPVSSEPSEPSGLAALRAASSDKLDFSAATASPADDRFGSPADAGSGPDAGSPLAALMGALADDAAAPAAMEVQPDAPEAPLAALVAAHDHDLFGV